MGGVLLGLVFLSVLWLAWAPIALLISLNYAITQKNPLMRRFVLQELMGAPWAPMRSQFAPWNFHHHHHRRQPRPAQPAPHLRPQPQPPQMLPEPPNDGPALDDAVAVQSDDEVRSEGLDGLPE